MNRGWRILDIFVHLAWALVCGAVITLGSYVFFGFLLWPALFLSRVLFFDHGGESLLWPVLGFSLALYSAVSFVVISRRKGHRWDSR